MAVQVIPRQERRGLSTALIITRRELRDSLRDWRIVTPIIVLTIIFPFLMDFTSRWATRWVSQYTDPILVERINPFLLMIVGFFPISFYTMPIKLRHCRFDATARRISLR